MKARWLKIICKKIECTMVSKRGFQRCKLHNRNRCNDRQYKVWYRNPKLHSQRCFQKLSKASKHKIRNEETHAGLVCDIWLPTQQWILDNLIRNDEKLEVTMMRFDWQMLRISWREHATSSKETRKYKEIFASNQKEMFENLEPNND